MIHLRRIHIQPLLRQYRLDHKAQQESLQFEQCLRSAEAVLKGRSRDENGETNEGKHITLSQIRREKQKYRREHTV